MLADFPRSVVEDAKQLGYHERKERLICTYPGCPEPGDGGECEGHQAKSNRRKRRWKKRRARAAQKRRRAEKHIAKIRARKKLCKLCTAKRLPGQDYCATHLVASGPMMVEAGDKKVDNKAARIAAHTSIDADGRSRFRGQGQRGQPKRSEVDDKDLEQAIEALRRAKHWLRKAAELDGAALAKTHRDQMRAEALHQVNLSGRHGDDVLARHGYFGKGKVDPDPRKIGR